MHWSRLSFLESNETHLTAKNDLNKVAIVGESNDAGDWGRRRVDGGSGVESPTMRRFLQYFSKKYAFLSTL